jgi:hypothetical protein
VESTGTAIPSGHRLRVLLNSNALAGSAIGRSEDPCDNLFTEEISFFGGSYLAVCGRGEETCFLMRLLTTSIFKYPSSTLPREFEQGARAIISAALTISDESTRKAGLRRGIAPKASDSATVPASAEFERLKAAAYVSDADLTTLQAIDPDFNSGLEALLTSPADEILDSYTINSGKLLRYPLVREKSGIVIVVPGSVAVHVPDRLLLSS